MEKLIEKVEKLKLELDEHPCIKDIKKLNQEIAKDRELIDLIKTYNITSDESLKQKITSNELFKIYKEKETDVNIIILAINQKLKEITNKGKCNL